MGGNMSDQVYYSTCPASRLNKIKAWITPLPIFTEVERISPYVNRADSGNTIFVFGNGKLQKLMHVSATTGRAWRSQEITLAAAPQDEPISFMSYTTSIHVTQSDKWSPEENGMVDLSASSRARCRSTGCTTSFLPIPSRSLPMRRVR